MMIKRNVVVLLLAVFLAVACAGNEAAAPAEVIQENGQPAPVAIETTVEAETAPTEASTPEAMDDEAAVPAASPTPRLEAASGATDTAPDAAVAPEAAGAEPDALIVCDGRPTPANPEGPFYRPNTPERASFIEQGMAGVPITISGRVLNTDCEPIPGAMVDFWQTDAAGEYDNSGYRLRGHQFTDEEGRYSLETIVPGQYPGRPAHIHLKVFTPDGREALTSQLYIPGISENVPDGFFDRALLVRLAAIEDGRQQGFFDFVVR